MSIQTAFKTVFREFRVAAALLAASIACGATVPEPNRDPVRASPPATGSWTVEAIGAGTDLLAVFGIERAGAPNVFVGGADGSIFRYDGERWAQTEFAAPGSQRSDRAGGAISGLWANNPDTVFSVRGGDRGVVFRFDGAKWQPHQSIPRMGLSSLWGAERILYVGGRDFLRAGAVDDSSSAAATRRFEDSFGVGVEIRAGWTTATSGAARETWLVGPSSDGTAQTKVLRRRDDFNERFGETSLGYLLGNYPSEETAREIAEASFVTIWGRDTKNIWIAGDRGIARCCNDLGAHWRAELWSSGSPAPGRIGSDAWPNIRGLHGDALTTVYAVGKKGRVFQRDSSVETATAREKPTNWRELPRLTDADLNAVWVSARGDVFAVGAGGVVVRYKAAAPLN